MISTPFKLPVQVGMRLRDCLTLLFLSFLVLAHVMAVAQSNPSLPPELLSPLIAQKLAQTASSLIANPSTIYPQYTDRTNGSWLYFPVDQWTTGFFPTSLYALNTRRTLCREDATLSNTDWLGLARAWSAAEVMLPINNTLGHDVGFVSYPFQEELLIDPTNESAISTINAFASDLAARFNPVVGCTRSWDSTDPDDFTVIIDNMMNLEIFFASANLTGNNTLRDMAISHATKTIENHVRPDGSSFHVVVYDAETGAVKQRKTSQGFADNSTWTRGQAWGLYGFAEMFQNTRVEVFLETSRRMSLFFINNIPTSGVVPWDFNAPDDPSRPSDSSAATISSAGLLLLSQLELSLSPPNTTGADLWRNAAIRILSNVVSYAWRPEWDSILSNGTVNNPASPPNNMTGIVYGDYYFIEAGNVLIDMGLLPCTNRA